MKNKIFIILILLFSTLLGEEEIDMYTPIIYSGKLNLKELQEETYQIEPEKNGYLSITGYNGVFCTVEVYNKNKKLLKRMINGQPLTVKVKKGHHYYIYIFARRFCKSVNIQYPDL